VRAFRVKALSAGIARQQVFVRFGGAGDELSDGSGGPSGVTFPLVATFYSQLPGERPGKQGLCLAERREIETAPETAGRL